MLSRKKKRNLLMHPADKCLKGKLKFVFGSYRHDRRDSAKTWQADEYGQLLMSTLCITSSIILLTYQYKVITDASFNLFTTYHIGFSVWSVGLEWMCMSCTCFSLLLKMCLCGALLQLGEPNTNPCHSEGDQWKVGKREGDARNSRADKWIDRDGWMEPGMKPIQK